MYIDHRIVIDCLNSYTSSSHLFKQLPRSSQFVEPVRQVVVIDSCNQYGREQR